MKLKPKSGDFLQTPFKFLLKPNKLKEKSKMSFIKFIQIVNPISIYLFALPNWQSNKLFFFFLSYRIDILISIFLSVLLN